MAASVFSSLYNLLDSCSINEIAGRLGEPGQAVSRSLESSTASLISCLAARSSDPHSMSQIFDLVTHAPTEINVSNLTSAVLSSGEASAFTSSLRQEISIPRFRYQRVLDLGCNRQIGRFTTQLGNELGQHSRAAADDR